MVTLIISSSLHGAFAARMERSEILEPAFRFAPCGLQGWIGGALAFETPVDIRLLALLLGKGRHQPMLG